MPPPVFAGVESCSLRMVVKVYIGGYSPFQYLLCELFNLPFDATPNGGGMITLLKIRGHHPFVFRFDK